MSNSKNFSLIVPAASDKGTEAGTMPHIFSTGRDGVLMCVKSVLGLNLEAFDSIYFTILRKHAEAFDTDSLLKLQFRRLGLGNVNIVILDEPTATQAETIVRTIEKEEITGSIFVKDADCFFRAEVFPENGVAVYPLEHLELVDPRHKSYVAVDDMQHVTNIIEKRVVSHLSMPEGTASRMLRNSSKPTTNTPRWATSTSRTSSTPCSSTATSSVPSKLKNITTGIYNDERSHNRLRPRQVADTARSGNHFS